MKEQKTHNKKQINGNNILNNVESICSKRHPRRSEGRNTQRGITLIALIITIIVLIILAVVSIRLVMNDDVLGKAERATKAHGTEAEIEQIKIGYSDYQMAKESGETDAKLTVAGAKKITGDATKGWTVTFDKTQYPVSSDGQIGDPETSDSVVLETFNPETLTIGTAINTDKYGWKVTNYNVEETETGGWRLFFQDNNYSYLISDNCFERDMPNDYYKTYKNGSFVSTVGQKLNPKIISLFTESNMNRNISATAWLTDTSDSSMWTKYKNDDAVFAIRKSDSGIICSIL